MEGLTKNNSHIIGFVYTCLFCGAITESDINEWAINTVLSRDINCLPTYIIDLMDAQELKSPSRGIEKIIGFVPSWKRKKEQEYALYGIAVKQGRNALYDAPVNEKGALDALRKHPEIEKLFRETFPFIRF
ncbi:hypothetical protein [Hafnia paralvei]|uniref:hypothetical protein n=1 Tax=Hafnia paralvei TaxID=546367 RepID=UPI0018F08465|nr:hypothetical protein [Hafnia paralvei]MBW2956288.1 hypothetical protein [Hafnia paralvei]MCQ4168159.1 hypothetical protein [Hafnia paralvei]MDX6839366.1 hypothetical protein [Hafnia paralvei]